MIRLLGKRTIRHTDIIKHLHINSNSISQEHLIRILEVTDSVLKSDIEYLNSNYPDILKIKTSNNIISIIYNNDSCIETFFRTIINNSNIFNMIEALFFYKFNSINSLAENQFTSISTIYRMIDKFNTAATNKYNFRLDKKSLKFIGSEKNIRSFFTQLFKEKYAIDEWPFININKNTIKKAITEYFKINNINKFEYSYLEIMSWTCAVNLHRTKLNFPVISQMETNKINYDIIKNLLKSNILQNIFRTFYIPLTENNLINIFYNYVHVDLVHTFKEFTDKADYSPNIAISLHRGFSDTFSIKNKYNLQLNNIENLIISVHNSAVLYNSDIKSNCVIYNRRKMYIDQIYKQFPELVTDIKTYLSNYLTSLKGSIKKNEVEHLTYVAVSTWKGLISQMYNLSDKLNVLIISRFNSVHASNIKVQLDMIFKCFFNTVLFDGNSLEIDNINFDDFDLVIADFIPVNNKVPNWIFIQETLNPNDFLEIIKKISKFIKYKF